jgi:hypothetical protein
MKLPLTSQFSLGAALALLLSFGTGAQSLQPNDRNHDSRVQMVQAQEQFSWEINGETPRVGLQIGHWKQYEAPNELASLRRNTGASGAGKTEWEVNYAIGNVAAEILREKGVEVDLLPTTIPPRYEADAFVTIHADGSLRSEKSGWKMASPWNDQTGKANSLVGYMEDEYRHLGLEHDYDNITPGMRAYYAFSWDRFEHAVSPSTPSAIVETGFLSSPRDRELIVDQPEVAGHAIAAGILRFLASDINK